MLSFGKYISSSFFAIEIIGIFPIRFSLVKLFRAELSCPLPPSIMIKFGNGDFFSNKELYLRKSPPQYFENHLCFNGFNIKNPIVLFTSNPFLKTTQEPTEWAPCILIYQNTQHVLAKSLTSNLFVV